MRLFSFSKKKTQKYQLILQKRKSSEQLLLTKDSPLFSVQKKQRTRSVGSSKSDTVYTVQGVRYSEWSGVEWSVTVQV